MKVQFYQTLKSKKKSDVLVLPFVKNKEKSQFCGKENFESENLSLALKSGDFIGDLNQVSLIYHSGDVDKRILLLGLGEKDSLTLESIRKAYSSLVKYCLKYKFENISILLPKLSNVSEDVFALGIAEGIYLSNYSHSYATSSKELKKLASLNIIAAGKREQEVFLDTELVSNGVYLSRDLVNKNADEVTPQYLVQIAKDIAKKHTKVSATIFNKERIEKEGMGLLIAVNRGSALDPAFIILKYAGAPASKDHTVLVGKGVTYDSGGLNLKPTGSMETMRCDMAGAATVLGIIEVVAALGLKVNVTAVIPSTENGISAASYKPGDVYVSYSGKTVEIGNTDAEGRLILADALSYSIKKLKPTRIIDFATLTGAMVISLGSVVTGMMSNDDALSNALTVSGEQTYERVWRLPLFEEYKTQIKSDIADIKNTGGRPAGAITAALFLEEFVEKTPWAHLDIAGTAFLEKEEGYLPKYGTGVGVRLIIDYLKRSLKNSD